MEPGNGHVAWRTSQVTIGAGLVQHCSASCWPVADMVLSMTSAQMMWRCGLHFGVTWWQVRPVVCTIRKPLRATWPRRGSQLLLYASRVVGVNTPRRLPSSGGSNSRRWLSVGSTWYRSWFVLVLVLCLAEQWWQRCPVCDNKVLQAGGEMAMAGQVLHVTNQGQSVRMRIREGMRGRSLGRPSNAPPCGCGDIFNRPLY